MDIGRESSLAPIDCKPGAWDRVNTRSQTPIFIWLEPRFSNLFSAKVLFAFDVFLTARCLLSKLPNENTILIKTIR